MTAQPSEPTNAPADDAILTTQRLMLREMREDDADDLFGMFSDPQARRYYPQMADMANVRDWIARSRKKYEELGFGLWAITLKESRRFVGDCGLTYQNWGDGPRLEVGYHLIESERGKGYAIEAARACLNLGFERTDAPEICSIVAVDNLPSQRVAGALHRERREVVGDKGPRYVFFTTRADWGRSRPRNA